MYRIVYKLIIGNNNERTLIYHDIIETTTTSNVEMIVRDLLSNL